MFKEFCLHIAKNAFDYGFYSLDATGTLRPALNQGTLHVPGLGEGELLRGTQNPTEVSKEILKECIERQ